MPSEDREPVRDWTEEELACWLAFDQMPKTGLQRLKGDTLLRRFGSMTALWRADKRAIADAQVLNPEYIDLFVAARAQVDPEKLLKALNARQTIAIPYDHPLFPLPLKVLKKKPWLLYVRGELLPDEYWRYVAVVGTRRPTGYGQRMAKKVGRELAELGAVVVSGMAIGIDSLAHWGAIEGGGKTIAVAACGPDMCIPTSNKMLYKKIVDEGRGAVVSEYFPGTEPSRWTFPQRNRIISGLCEGVAIIEAGERSGALITARIALSDHRQVFAVPGRVDSPLAYGTNRLIATQAAQLITNARDLVEELGSWKEHLKQLALGKSANAPKRRNVELSESEQLVFDFIQQEEVQLDSICEGVDLKIGPILAALTALEFHGLIERMPGDWYAKL